MKKKLHALIIEDSEDDAELLVRDLGRAGFDVTHQRVDAPSGLNAALDAQAWDIIFCDYSMPHFNGTDALYLMKGKNLDVPFIFVSGTMGEDAAVSAIQAGAYDYVMKGNMKRLAPAVTRALREAELHRERKQSEDRLRESEEQFRLIAENITDLIAVLDLEGRRLYSSPSYGRILGDVESLRGTDSFQEIHPDDRERVREIFRETVRTGTGQRAEFRFVTRDGAVRFIESQGSVIRNERGEADKIVVVSRDITEKRKLELQFLRSQRMESIGTLAGGIAHDLNNVLSPITMALDILRRRFPDSDSKPILDTLQSSAHRGASMIRQVLAFARGVEGERMILQPAHLLEEVGKIAADTFPKSIQVRTDIGRSLWTVTGDPTQIHQVLLNLCVNARDAMPNGGVLKMGAENVKLDEQYARMHVDAKAGDYVAMQVSDTGMGIPAGVIDKIFDPFFTTKEVGKGTGLGLSTVLAIVRSHGGFINVYSEPGQGTVFTVYLPGQSKQGPSADVADRTVLPEGEGELILVIDDEASIREITKETLETYGYEVITANDGAEGVALYSEHKRRVKAVLTDMMMPYMDGEATIRALQKINPGVKIIMASGLTTNGKTLEASHRSVHSFLTKPYTAEKLLKTLRDVLVAPPASTSAPS